MLKATTFIIAEQDDLVSALDTNSDAFVEAFERLPDRQIRLLSDLLSDFREGGINRGRAMSFRKKTGKCLRRKVEVRKVEEDRRKHRCLANRVRTVEDFEAAVRWPDIEDVSD